MTTPHRATPEHWEHVQISAGMKQQIPWATADCILELRSRIEALEATQHAPTTADARPGGLVERVVEALADEFQPSGTWHDEARAAIREVAAWLDTKGQHGCSLWLREEADQ
jgi:hypothetical protein